MAYVRTVRTGSGAIAVQIVHGSRRGARDIEHLGSAHDEQAVEALKTVARQRLAGGQGELELDLDAGQDAAGQYTTGSAAAVGGGVVEAGAVPITFSQMAVLWEALRAAYDQLGFGAADEGDEVFRQLVLARIIEPTSKRDKPARAGRDRRGRGLLRHRQAPPAHLRP